MNTNVFILFRSCRLFCRTDSFFRKFLSSYAGTDWPSTLNRIWNTGCKIVAPPSKLITCIVVIMTIRWWTCIMHRASVKDGPWTVDWTMDWTSHGLDWTGPWRLCWPTTYTCTCHYAYDDLYKHLDYTEKTFANTYYQTLMRCWPEPQIFLPRKCLPLYWRYIIIIPLIYYCDQPLWEIESQLSIYEVFMIPS